MINDSLGHPFGPTNKMYEIELVIISVKTKFLNITIESDNKIQY